MMPFEARAKRGKLLLLMLACVGVIVASLCILLIPGALDRYPRFGWLFWSAALIGVPFFSVGLFLLLRMQVSGKIQVRVDGRGIHWERWSDETIPWSAIADVRTFTVMNQPSLCLHLHDPARYPSKSFVLRASAKANRNMGAGDVSISMSGLDRSHDDLVAAVQAWRPR